MPHHHHLALALLSLSAFQPFSPSALSAASAAPADYPIGAIVQPARNTSLGALTGDRDNAAAINATQVIYGSDGAPLRAVLRSRNRLKIPIPTLVYTGGLTTNPGTDLAALERNYRSAIAMTPAATLAADIDAATTQIPLADPTGGELAIKASTAAYSDSKDSSKFCFWIRIDDELMRVTAITPARQRPIQNPVPSEATSSSKIQNSIVITVERGFSKTTPAPHAARARVFSPVYQGNREDAHAARHPNAWPGSTDDPRLLYTLDPRSPDAQKFKAALVVDVMRQGCDGAWFDTFQIRPFNICDALGRKLANFWDFKTGATYQKENYIEAMKDYLRGIRALVRAATGREPVIFANNVTGTYKDGAKQIFNHGDTRDLLDGYSFEDSYFKTQATRDKTKSNEAKASFFPLTGDKWLTNVTNHADAATSGLRGLCMAGPAGYVAQYINSAQPNYAQLIRYAYASFLLTVTKERTTMFGLPMLVSDKNAATGIVPWPRVLNAGIGDPLQENKIDTLKVPGTPCYMRRFQNGIAIVNPSAEGKSPSTVPIPAGYIDAMTGKPAPTQLALPPADAAILIRVR